MNTLSKELPVTDPDTAADLPSVCLLSGGVHLAAITGPQARPPFFLLRIAGASDARRIGPHSSLVLEPLENGHTRLLYLFRVPRLTCETLFFGFMDPDTSEPEVRESAEIIVDSKTFLRQHLTSLPSEKRHEIISWLAQSIFSADENVGRSLAEKLYQIRDTLRERSPAFVITPDKHRGMHIDHLFRLDDRAFYMRGWASVGSGPLARLLVISPEGLRVDITNRVFWHTRPDINKLYNVPSELADQWKAGFLCYIELPMPSALERGWVVEATDADEESFEATCPAVTTDLKQARDFVTGDLHHERLPAKFLRANHTLPAVTRLQERHRASLKLNFVQQYGRPPENPEISLIIPLYRRTDFLEHQLAQFVHDPVMKHVDLIYMLDSPELAETLRNHSAVLHEVYELPFRLASMVSNAGFAGVNNMASTLARGRLLLLMNSDILPDRPGWLERMRNFYDSKANIGALGAKLLFEDDTLQHAGMYFRPERLTGLWENQHYFKGLDRSLPPANLTRQVPAVSAACMMIDRKLYLDLGGLRGVYVQGDYEDSDLCLRLQELGREIWYLPTVELYHLEGQSYGSEDRARNLALNRWVHSWFWDKQITQRMTPNSHTT